MLHHLTNSNHLLTFSKEYFADYAPLLPSLFSLNYNASPGNSLYGSTPNAWNPAALERSIQGVIGVLLSLKKRPIIRYERMSGMAKKLGSEILHRIQSEAALFDFRLTQVQPLLLILDRRNDPLTPLLSQWTYQAMVHELLGIRNGRVDLSTVPDIRSELKVCLFIRRSYKIIDTSSGNHSYDSNGPLLRTQPPSYLRGLGNSP